MPYAKSLRFRLMLLPTVPLIIVGVLYIAISMITSNVQVDKNSVVASEASEHTIVETINEWTLSTLSLAQIIVDNPSQDFITAMNNKNRTKIIELSQNVYEASGHDAMTFTDMNGDVIARVQNPDKYGDNITGSLAAADALEGNAVSYVYPTLNNGFSIAAGVPIFDDADKQIGVLVFIRRLDGTDTLESLKRYSGAEIVVYQADTALVSTLENSDAYDDVIDPTTWAILEQGTSVVTHTTSEGVRVTERFIPIEGRDGLIVGVIKAIKTPENSTWITLLWIVVFLISAIIFTPIISFNVKKLIMPIRDLSEQAQILATGNVSNDIAITRTDEIGILQRSMQNLTESLRQTSDLMEGISQGDFSEEYTPLSDDDILGKSIVKMLDGNNTLLRDIQFAAQQVAEDSSLIASGAQTLAAGSTEQAATVEELSAAIVEVRKQAEHGAVISEGANNEVQKVGELMNETNVAMDAMALAMAQIKEQSDEIAKVIKVIDDIAFRTNILALNAAVEAARAGMHGKGFAVVADEVKNLAAKSAAAAQETAVLIEKSIETFKTGSDVAEKVIDSMDQTASIASASAATMENVTTVCRQSSIAVSEISEGINQIAKVIQANTATADQSAISSQELSKQGSTLMGIVKKYKLRDALYAMHDFDIEDDYDYVEDIEDIEDGYNKYD